MATIAELKIVVDTTELDSAKKSLDGLGDAASKAENTSAKLASGMKQMGDASDQANSAAEKLLATAKEKNAVWGKGTAALYDYRAAQLGISSAMQPFTDGIRSQVQAKKDDVAATREHAAVLKASQRSQEGLGTAQYKMIESLREEIALFGKSKEEILLYRAGLMGIEDTVRPLVQQLNALKQAKAEESAIDKAANTSTLTKRQKETQALREEEVALRRLIDLDKQRIALANTGIPTFTQIQEKASDVDSVNKTRKERLERLAAAEATARHNDELARNEQRFKELAYSIDPTIAKLDALDNKQSELNQLYKKGVVDPDTYNEYNNILDRQRESVTRNNVAVASSATEFNKLRAAIDPAAAAMDKLNDQQKQLNSMKGSIPTAEFNRLNTMLDAGKKRIQDLGATTGKTAKEINFAMRGLPAQFTDIFVSLQGGQAPLTVFLQQGGQLKDMFGGVGPAFKAMGGYILGLINPITVAATVLGTLGIAAYKGSEEINKFNKATIQSGGYSGVSAQGFMDLRNSIDSITGTAGQAAAALTLLQSSGKIDGSMFESISVAAIKMQRTTGVAIEDTIADFNSLTKDPLEAAATLDEKYRFLTSSVVATTQALIEQGHTQDAVKLLQSELAAAVSSAADEMVNKGGYVERAWRGVKDVVMETWDAIKDIGRDTTLTDKISELQQEIDDIDAGKGFLGFLGADTNMRKFRLNMLKSQLQTEQFNAAQKAAEEQSRRTGVAISTANARAAQTNMNLLDPVKGALTEYEKIIENGVKLRRAATLEKRDLTSEEIKYQEIAEKAALKRYEDAKASSEKKVNSKSSKVPNYQEDAATKLLATLRQQQEVYSAQIENKAKLLSEQDKYNKLVAQITQAEEKVAAGKATEDQKSLVINKEALLAEQSKLISQQKQIEAQKEINRLKGVAAQLDDVLKTDKQSYEDAQRGASLSDKENQRMQERIKLQREYDNNVQRLNSERDANPNDPTRNYEAELELYKQSLSDRLSALQENYRAMDAIQSDWQVGASKAWQNYLEEGRNVAGLTQSFFTNALSSMTDAITGFVTTGKMSFKDLTVSILKDLTAMATRIAMNRILMSVLGSSLGGSGSNISDYTGDAFKAWVKQAKGGAWNGGTQFFAKGGAFTNSVVKGPTAFNTGGGLGVMGEAGPEAIMPLSRTSDGSLGVRMTGSSTSTVVAPISVSVQTSGGGAGQGGEGQARAVQHAIKVEVEKTIQQGLQAGGSIWRAMNNR